MRTLAQLLLPGLTLPLMAGWAAATPRADKVQAQAERVVQELVASSGFSGAVVLLRDGQAVYERAVGLAQRNPDRPFTPDTPSDGGSLAKTLTAATVWELAAEGRLGLDDPVTRHLPAYPYAGQSVRQLVTHRNGLPDYDALEAEFAPGQVRDTADLLRAAARRQPKQALAAGVDSEYSNLGFDTAALLVEAITGQPIAVFWRERYLAPLGISGMFARPPRFADWQVPRTVGYQRKGEAWELSDAYDGEAHVGASNVHASARDWARWGDAFARGRVMAGPRLQTGLARPMLASGLDDVLTALSWYCDASRQRCHYTGAYNGFYAQVLWDRARQEVVAYVNNSSLPPWRCARFTRELADALAGRAPVAESSQELLRWRKAERERFAGIYRSPSLGLFAIDVRDGRAFVRANDGDRVSIFALPDGVFYVPMLDLWLGFTGTPDAPTLQIRSVFHVAEAVRQTASAGPSR
jgi:CubicO group peptidase (beta-lactamase class C family)